MKLWDLTAGKLLRELPPQLAESAQRLMAAYAAAHGRRLALTVAAYFEMGGASGAGGVPCASSGVFMTSKEPRRVREPMVLLMRQVMEVEAEARQLLPAMGGLESPASPTGAASIGSDVARMVQAGAGSGAGSKFKYAEEVVSYALSAALGALLDRARDTTFSRAGFQQLQVDLHSLRSPLRRFSVGKGLPVDNLLDRVAAAAADRCVAVPELLDKTVLERIVGEARQM